MPSLKDQVVLVTGASSGIGKAMALAVASHGATLCLLGRKVEGLEKVAEDARKKGSRVQFYEVDLTVDNDIEKMKANLERDCGRLDVLIHSAGVICLGEVESASVGDLDWQYSVNIRAPYFLTQALLPMLQSQRGQIAFVNSNMGLNARGNLSQYAATKHALKAFADSLREEVNPKGVRVLSIFLGRTASPMQEIVHRVEGRAYNPDVLVQPHDVATMVTTALTLPRTAEVTEINIRPMIKAY